MPRTAGPSRRRRHARCSGVWHRWSERFHSIVPRSSSPDSMHAFHRRKGGTQTRAQVAEQLVHRPDKAANILAPVETQCDWLRQIGFTDVDCFFKVFELAVFGGRRVSRPQSKVHRPTSPENQRL